MTYFRRSGGLEREEGSLTCDRCGETVTGVTLITDHSTGAVEVEGAPDRCPECDNDLSDAEFEGE